MTIWLLALAWGALLLLLLLERAWAWAWEGGVVGLVEAP